MLTQADISDLKPRVSSVLIQRERVDERGEHTVIQAKGREGDEALLTWDVIEAQEEGSSSCRSSSSPSLGPSPVLLFLKEEFKRE